MITNNEFVKNSSYTLNEIFELFKDQQLTSQEWAEILKAREGKLNFSSLYDILKKNISYFRIKSKYFTYKGNQYWLDKDTRIVLIRLIDSGTEQVTLQLGDNYITITSDKLKTFLNQLEVYAGQCFTAEAQHLQNLNKLTTKDELLSYDYTTGYPSKITLNEDQC